MYLDCQTRWNYACTYVCNCFVIVQASSSSVTDTLIWILDFTKIPFTLFCRLDFFSRVKLFHLFWLKVVKRVSWKIRRRQLQILQCTKVHPLPCMLTLTYTFYLTHLGIPTSVWSNFLWIGVKGTPTKILILIEEYCHLTLFLLQVFQLKRYRQVELTIKYNWKWSKIITF
jgi:hypothetical protein